MNTYTPQLYSIDDDIAWKTYLDNYGFVVIKDILDVKGEVIYHFPFFLAQFFRNYYKFY